MTSSAYFALLSATVNDRRSALRYVIISNKLANECNCSHLVSLITFIELVNACKFCHVTLLYNL